MSAKSVGNPAAAAVPAPAPAPAPMPAPAPVSAPAAAAKAALPMSAKVPPPPPTGRIGKLIQKARRAIPQVAKPPYLKIASESVYFGSAASKAPIQFRRDYAPQITDEEEIERTEQLFHLFFEKGQFRQPETGPLCNEDDFQLILKALWYRFRTLREAAKAELGRKGDTTTTRQKLGHLLDLKAALESVEDAQKVCATQVQTGPPPTADEIQLNLPIELDDAQIQELVRKFAFLILHAQHPLEGNERFDKPAIDIIEKIDAIEEIPDIETFIQTLVNSLDGEPLNEILDLILRLGVVGFPQFHSEYQNIILERYYTTIVNEIQATEVLPPRTKQMILQQSEQGTTPEERISRIIYTLMELLRRCESEKLKLQNELNTLKKQKAECDKRVTALTAQFKAKETELANLKAEQAKQVGAATERQRAELEAAATAQRDRLNASLAEAQNQVTTLTRQLEECNQKLQAATGTEGALKNTMTAANRRISELEEQMRQKDVRIKELEDTLANQKQLVATAQAAAAEAEKKMGGLEAELAAFRKQSPLDEAAAAAQAKRIGELEAGLAAAQKSLADKQAELDAATAKAAKIQKDLEAEQSKTVQSEATKVQLQEQIDTHRQEKEGAVAQAALSQEAVEAQKALVEKLRGDLEAAERAKAADASTIGKLRADLATAMGAATELAALKEAKAGVDAELANLRSQLGEKNEAYTQLEATTKQKMADAEKACLARIEAAKQEILANARKELESAASGAGAQIASLQKQVADKTAAEAAAKQQGQAALENLRKELIAKAAADAAAAKTAAETTAAGVIDGLRKELEARKADIDRLVKELEAAKAAGAASLQAKIEELQAAHRQEKERLAAEAAATLGTQIAQLKAENKKTLDAELAKLRTEQAGQQAEAVASAVSVAKEEAAQTLKAQLAAAEAASVKRKEELTASADKTLAEKLQALRAEKDAEMAKKEAEIRAQMEKVVNEALAAKRGSEDALARKTTEYAELQKLIAELQKTLEESKRQLGDTKAKYEQEKAAATAAFVAKEASVRKELETKFEAEKKALASQLEEAKREAMSSAMKLTGLTEELAKIQAALKKGEGDIASLTAKRAELEKALAAASAQAATANQEKTKCEARIAELLKEKDAALEKLKKDLTAEFTAKLAAVEAAKKESERLSGLARLEMDSTRTALAQMKAERNAAAGERDAQLAKVQGLAAEAKKAVGERDAQLAKLRGLAAEVARGEFDLDKYAGPNDAPLRELLNKVQTLSKTPMIGNDICALMYFVTYFINTIFRANAAKAQNFYGQIQGAVFTAINAIKSEEADKSETALFFRLLEILQPYLFLAEKVLGTSAHQPSETSLFMIRTDEKSINQFNAIYTHIKDMGMNTTLAMNLVKRRVGGADDIAFFPRAASGNAVLKSSSIMVFEPYSGTLGKAVDLRSDPGRRLLRYKVWENGAITGVPAEFAAQELTAAFPDLFQRRPITHDILFCMYVVSAQLFINSLDATKLKCPVPAELRDPFRAPLPVPTVAPPTLPPVGSDPFTSAALTFGTRAPAASTAAVPPAAPAPAPPLPIDPLERGRQVLQRSQSQLSETYRSIKCEKTVSIPRASNPQKGIKLSDIIIKTITYFPYCFRDIDSPLGKTGVSGFNELQQGVTYNLSRFLDELNKAIAANPGAPLPAGFIKQPDGKYVPRGKDTFGLFDLSSERGAVKGGNRTQKKRRGRGGKHTTRKNKTRNRR